MRYEKRFENGYASVDISPQSLRRWGRESRELLFDCVSKLTERPIEDIRREMRFEGFRLIRGGKL